MERDIKKGLGNFIQEVSLKIKTTLSPFGCGYVQYQDQILEVHDHDLSNIQGSNNTKIVELIGEDPEVYDPDKHGKIINWLEVEENLETVGLEGPLHTHFRPDGIFGAHEYKHDKSKKIESN